MSSSKKVNKSGKSKVNVVEVECVDKLDRKGRTRVVMVPVKHNRPPKQETPVDDRKLKMRKSPSPVACGSDHGVKRSKISKVRNSFPSQILTFKAQC
jgi:hypothetical protein